MTQRKGSASQSEPEMTDVQLFPFWLIGSAEFSMSIVVDVYQAAEEARIDFEGRLHPMVRRDEQW